MIDLRQGDCLEVMRTLPDNSIHACVTDPPYGLAFMGKKWDYDVPAEDVWREVRRILKPGGFLLSFSGTRTYHRMTVRIEDAGFEIRDMIQWLYGSGFPKSHDVSKAIDRETAPATDAAKQWEGFGTALKPANEPICVARKPLIGTVAQNVLAHGCGGLNIDACRVEGCDEWTRPGKSPNNVTGAWGSIPQSSNGGRWPANVVHDGSDEVLELFPQTGSGGFPRVRNAQGFRSDGLVQGETPEGASKTDAGSAARFFYSAKADRAEREKGCEGKRTLARSGGAQIAEASGENYDQAQTIGLNRVLQVKNNHPTVKPVDLMRWLVRLVCPPDGVVLDPYTGSGTTGVACRLEGFGFIGIELNPEYIELARQRINAETPSLFAGLDD